MPCDAFLPRKCARSEMEEQLTNLHRLLAPRERGCVGTFFKKGTDAKPGKNKTTTSPVYSENQEHSVREIRDLKLC